MNKKKDKTDPAAQAYQAGLKLARTIPILKYLFQEAYFNREKGNLCPEHGWAVVTSNGVIHLNHSRRARPEQWCYIIAHCLLHLGLGHFKEQTDFPLWNIACDHFIAEFLYNHKIGKPPDKMSYHYELPASSEERYYKRLLEQGPEQNILYYTTGTIGKPDMIMQKIVTRWNGKTPEWEHLFALGIADAVSAAINKAADKDYQVGRESKEMTLVQKARRWFISRYPLLGALAARFDIIEDAGVCSREKIRFAAVNGGMSEIYFNPHCGFNEEEYRFVIAHELLHVSLAHQQRCRGRDPFYWNVACDYVINGWLVEMGVGEMPRIGVLYDPEFKGMSCEHIYDRIVTDLRKFRKLATLRGIGLGDMLSDDNFQWWERGKGLDLDAFYREALAQGLEYHQFEERGYLPAGLIEEIRALSQPPIPWDVELAKWFDDHFSPLEKRRSYARPSRRQSSTPDIPRPSWVPAQGADDGRTFGVILDTSGSMDRVLLAKALGTIAGYSMSRDVPRVRVIFADAHYYDQGYMAPEDIAGRVKVKGRGGTVLQPAVNFLQSAQDFPKEGPILIITDGFCDKLTIKRDHAYVIPAGHHLPFVTRGKVFYIR